MNRRVVLNLLAVAALLGTTPAAAQLADTMCLTGFNCAAGDVGLQTLEVTQVIDPCTGPGDTATVVFRAFIHNNVGGSSYDVAVFMATDGGSVSGVGAACYHTYFPPNFTTTPTYTDIDGDGTPDIVRPLGASNPPFFEEDDECGDLQAGTEGVLEFGPVTVACVDTTGDGLVDISVGISNKANSSANCSGVSQAVPLPASKCTIARVNFSSFPVPVELQGLTVD